jgi:hypothetical protein
MTTHRQSCSIFSRLAGALALALGITLAAPALAHDGPGGPVGIGVGLGAPTGLSLEFSQNGGRDGLELAIGDNAFHGADGYAHLVYKLRLARLVRNSSISIPFYLGLGAFVADHDHFFDDDQLDLGARMPIGLNFDLQSIPLQIFTELALGVPLVTFHHEHGHHLAAEGYAGVRVWF